MPELTFYPDTTRKARTGLSFYPDEDGFSSWYSGVADVYGIDPDPDKPEHPYDYRGYYNKNVRGREKDWLTETIQTLNQDPEARIFEGEFEKPTAGAPEDAEPRPRIGPQPKGTPPLSVVDEVMEMVRVSKGAAQARPLGGVAEEVHGLYPPIPYEEAKDDPIAQWYNLASGVVRFPFDMAALAEQVVYEPEKAIPEFGEFLVRGAGKIAIGMRYGTPLMIPGEAAERLTMAVLPQKYADIMAEARRRGKAVYEQTKRDFVERPVETVIELTAPVAIGKGVFRKGKSLLTKKPPDLAARLKAVEELDIGVPRKVITERLKDIREGPEPVVPEVKPKKIVVGEKELATQKALRERGITEKAAKVEVKLPTYTGKPGYTEVALEFGKEHRGDVKVAVALRTKIKEVTEEAKTFKQQAGELAKDDPARVEILEKGLEKANEHQFFREALEELEKPAEKVPAKKEVKPEPEKAPVEPKIAPKVEEVEPSIIGLNKAEQDAIRKFIDRPEFTPVEKRSFKMSTAEAKQGRFDENALSIADEVLKSKRPISDVEHAGMVLRAAKLKNEYKVSIKETSSLIERGEIGAAKIERIRSETIADQLEKLTDAGRQGRRETARALSIGRMMVDLDTYDLAPIMQRARVSKGTKLTPAESAKFEKMTAENSSLETALKEVETKYEKLLADKEKGIAEAVTRREARKAKVTQRTATAREKILADRTNIKKQLTEMGFRVNDISGVTAEGAYLVGKLATTYIKEGALTLKEVVQKVLVDLPQLTERDVYRSLASKNPKAQKRAATEVTRRISRLKTEARLLSEIKDAEEGIFGPRKVRPEQSRQIKRLQRKLRELRNSAYRSGIEATKLEKAIQTINELQDQLANHYRTIRKGKRPEGPELTATREKIRELRSQMRVEDEIARLDEQLRTGEFEVRERPVPKEVPPEIEKAQIELKSKRSEIRAAIDAMSPWTARKVGIEAINTARTLKATGEMSGALRQGLILTLRMLRTDPVKAVRIHGRAVKSFFSKYTADQIDNAIRSADHHYIREKSGLELTKPGDKLVMREEHFQTQVIQRIPVIGEVVKAAERHMVSVLNMLRAEAFDQFLKKYPNATHAELSAWADAVNVFSGRGNLGRFRAIANTLSLGIFAPRFAISRVQTPYMFFKYFKEPRVRAEIAKDLVTTAGFGLTILTLAELSGFDVGTDLRDADIGKIKVGDTRIDIWAGMQQPMRLITRLGVALTDKAGLTGEDLTEREKEFDPVEAFGRFAGYKLAPSIRIPSELIKGRTLFGDKVTPGETAARAMVPIAYESVYDAWKAEGWRQAALTGGLEFFGVGVQTYKDSQSRTRRQIRRMAKADNLDGAYQKFFQWNLENPQNIISEDWYNNVVSGKWLTMNRIREMIGRGKISQAEEKMHEWNAGHRRDRIKRNWYDKLVSEKELTER